MKKKAKAPTFHEQMTRSIAELQAIMARGESPTRGGQLTVRRVHVKEPGQYNAGRIRTIRESLNVSQVVFAQLLGVSPVLVRSWERGARAPAPIARRLIDQVCDNPSRFVSLVQLES